MRLHNVSRFWSACVWVRWTRKLYDAFWCLYVGHRRWWWKHTRTVKLTSTFNRIKFKPAPQFPYHTYPITHTYMNFTLVFHSSYNSRSVSHRSIFVWIGLSLFRPFMHSFTHASSQCMFVTSHECLQRFNSRTCSTRVSFFQFQIRREKESKQKTVEEKSFFSWWTAEKKPRKWTREKYKVVEKYDWWKYSGDGV